MTKKEQVRRRIIELIHGCEYGEALVLEGNVPGSSVCDKEGICPAPITLARLLKARIGERTTFAIEPNWNHDTTSSYTTIKFYSMFHAPTEFNWLLSLPNGQDATLDDQSEKTIEALHQLLCNNAHN